MPPADHLGSPITTITAIALVALLVAVSATAAFGVTVRSRPLITAAATAGLVFQLGHLLEHGLQTAAWFADPTERPWMSPWAMGLADGLQRLVPDRPGLGMEALHLVGNAVFLVGALAFDRLVRHGRTNATGGSDRARRPARNAVVVQSLHAAEHLVLTVTLLAAGRPLGISTLFGLVDGGAAMSTYRVWWHFSVNLVGSVYVAMALRAHVAVVIERWPDRSIVPIVDART